ncbi:hypothetical protein HYV49_05225 [Candidatus Pacearchaeota archaeon]|nr:hypothetical protein [Candidatus Pacearchaeota archaeon]
MANILKQVGLADQVEVRVFSDHYGNVNVVFDPIDPSKNVICDEKALESLNAELNERMQGMSLNHPNTIPWIKEYCLSWLNEFHKHDLVILEDASLKD